jgi:glutamine synthetase
MTVLSPTEPGIVQIARDAGVRLVRFLYCDNGGVIRGKLTHIEGLGGRLWCGFGLTVAMQAFNMLDHLVPFEGMGPVGEVRLMADPASFKLLPYVPRSAAMIADLLTSDRRPWGACPRSFLKRMIARATKQGIVVRAALENEFILCRQVDGKMVPADEDPCFSTIAMQESALFVDDLVTTFEGMGMAVDAYYPEYGHGQHELTLRHAEALIAADNQIFYRDAVRGVARNHGLYTSFAAKPFPDQPGSGCHIHCSLWDPPERTNLLWSARDPYHFSDLGYHFIAGIVAHLPGLVALTAPTYNSYRRLKPHLWASAFTAWGPDNREGAVRIASPFWDHEEDSINFELKASDPSNNPYLALGGMIAAGLDGIARRLDPGEPMLVDPGDLDDAELRRRGIERLPDSLAVALNHLEQDELLMDALGPALAGSYLAVKRSEWEAFAAEGEEFEIAQHFHRF